PVQRATPPVPAAPPAPAPAPKPPPASRAPHVQRRAARAALPDEPPARREWSDADLDELTHRLIGRVTRLLRTELRLDRERVGRLRDPRS
ncbi:extensin, partial [Streptomyces sp. ME12-02E]|nr:extensin [Streptomyces sp. ME12-02E]